MPEDARREIIPAGVYFEVPLYVLYLDGGVMTYRRMRDGGIIDHHWRTRAGAGDAHSEWCPFTNGECFFDGTHLGPYSTDEDEIWRELERRAPVACA